ncbi:RluA family pseudouridine synthase [Neolewinella lacunae]|uniref:RluA family pseudouridine synthase n=1 Tax=Neolewinella lacunae TaxID=1517758 RepID=A0A923PJW3_9BACT|nr:RluA family pseudouridine synthase [Neolewinella lacunae]MBC6993920.1 RluA family pseudouridine synthase [Neolewinella lacunae]MDN3634999.1 RluA family pseudouridine synthase [Neolewinella lacunae]
MNFQILFEDNHLIAINKPAGLLSQSDITGDETVMDWAKRYIKLRYNKPGDVFLGSVHRLDRPVSGLILFARTSKALTRMNEQFRDRQVAKTYWAIVGEQPDPIEGSLSGFLYKDSEKNRSKIVPKADSNRHQGAKLAKLSYRLLGRVGSNVLLEVTPETGRPHQIRVQLADQLKTPIQGDVKYGSRYRNDQNTINLHSRSLRFEHPVKKETVHIIAPIPQDDQLWQLFGEMTEW